MGNSNSKIIENTALDATLDTETDKDSQLANARNALVQPVQNANIVTATSTSVQSANQAADSSATDAFEVLIIG